MVLCLISNKGLDSQCKKLMKELNEQTTVLEALKHKSIGPWDSSSEEDPDKIKAKIKETKELALETQKQYNEVVASTYKLLCNLLAGEPQSQWNRMCVKCTSVTRGLVVWCTPMWDKNS